MAPARSPEERKRDVLALLEREVDVYLRLTPQRIQAWREVNELRGRHVMRGGAWV